MRTLSAKFADMNDIKYKILLLWITFTITGGISLHTGISFAEDLTPPQYVPNEIIVKFKANVADDFEQEIVTKGKPRSKPSFPASLDRLNKKYKVKKLTPIFKNFKKNMERLEALKQKEESLLTKKEKHLLRRLKRAPKDAKIPDLSGIYKLKIKGSVEEAVAEYSKDLNVEYAEMNYIVSISPPLYRLPLQQYLGSLL